MNYKLQDKRLEEWLTNDPDFADFNQWLLDILRIGVDTFNLDSGIISLINNRKYTVLQVVTVLDHFAKVGDEYELDNTYCEAVVRQHKTITYIQAGNIPEMRLHPVYISMQLESYIGTPIISREGLVIGTINFSSHNARSTIFSQNEILFIETVAKKLSNKLQSINSRS